MAFNQRSATDRSDFSKGTWNRNASAAFLVASEYRAQLLKLGGMARLRQECEERSRRMGLNQTW
jgi:hypothetical protein